MSEAEVKRPSFDEINRGREYVQVQTDAQKLEARLAGKMDAIQKEIAEIKSELARLNRPSRAKG